VTGADLSSQSARVPSLQLDLFQRTLTNLGVGLLGMALVFHGLGNKLSKKEID
jgi:hypothetical protein